MYKLLAATNIDGMETLFDELKDLVHIDVVPAWREEIMACISEYDGYLCPLEVRTDREILERGKKLKAVFTVTTGLDHIDLDIAREKGIAVYGMKNDREFLDNVTATAELALGLLLALERRLPWAFDAVKQGIWDREAYKGHQLNGKTMGIWGYGRLGTIMRQYAQALRMRVIAYDTCPSDSPDVEWVSREELLSRSDVISLHIHLNESTHNLLNRDVFHQMKPGMIIINTSRGGIINEPDLIHAMDSGIVRGFAGDVITGEWGDVGDNLLVQYAKTHENLLLTPHIGGACYEAQLQALGNVLAKVRDFFQNACRPDATEVLARSLMNGTIN